MESITAIYIFQQTEISTEQLLVISLGRFT
jgi:hypothetical protein